MLIFSVLLVKRQEGRCVQNIDLFFILSVILDPCQEIPWTCLYVAYLDT